MAARIVAIINQKGGVGKTTTTVNIGAILASEYGRRVLLVDLDPQGNMSDHVGLDPNRVTETVYDVLVDGLNPRQAIRRVHGLEALPANQDLSSAEFELAADDDRNTRLRDALATVRDQYDYILMDCPPGLGLMTVSALAAADSVLVAMEAEYLALRGISQLLQTVEKVKQAINPGLRLSGVLFCRYDARTNLSREVKAEVETHMPGKVFETTVRQNVRLAEAPSHGLSIIEYDAGCAGADDYRAVTAEFLARFGEAPAAPASPAETEYSGAPVETPILPEDDGRGSWQRQPRWMEREDDDAERDRVF